MNQLLDSPICNIIYFIRHLLASDAADHVFAELLCLS